MSSVLQKEDQHWPTLFQAGYQPSSPYGKLDDHCQFTEESLHGPTEERLHPRGGLVHHGTPASFC
jgi:hypothetical protein